MNFIHLNGVLLHYKYLPSKKQGGDSRSFVFINSLGTDFRIWEEVAAIMNEEGNVLLFDKRGHGLSGIPLKANGLYSYAKDLLGLMDHLSIKSATVVGVSMGGMIAQLLAFHHPGSVDHLVLCDTRHRIGNDQVWNDRIQEVKKYGLKRIAEEVMHRWFPEKFWEERPTTVSGCQLMVERTSAQGYAQACECIRDSDLAGNALQLKLPTLCIVGSEDRSTPPRDVKSLADLIKGSRYHVIEGSGHIPCVDNPGELTRVILNFVNGGGQ
jgi:3-oxoadipate enol-lactonase